MLYDFLFMWWDFKQAVRANASKHIDVLWAEFVPMGRTTTANKTHYGVLALMQVYLGCALHPELDHLKEDVVANISIEQIQRRLQDHRFLDVVDHGLIT